MRKLQTVAATVPFPLTSSSLVPRPLLAALNISAPCVKQSTFSSISIVLQRRGCENTCHGYNSDDVVFVEKLPPWPTTEHAKNERERSEGDGETDCNFRVALMMVCTEGTASREMASSC